MTQGEATGWRPSVWTSLTQFWAISVLLTVAGAVLGFVAASAPTAKATSTASVILTDPGSNSLLSDSGTTHLSTQVAIIKLDSTVKAAAALLATRDPSAGVTFAQLKNELSVTNSTTSELVQVSVTDVRPLVAQAAANAVVDAYRAQAQKVLTDKRMTALANNQAAIDNISKNINVSAPVAAQQQLALAALYSQQAQIISDTSAANGPIQDSSPATLPTARRTVPPPIGSVVGGLVGLLAAVVLTRLLAQARQRFGGRFEPELIFDTPLLADVPTFSAERLPSDLPAVDSATSSVSEAYRFAATAIESSPVKLVAVVSAASSEGKSSCAANLAVTAAYQGARVLVIDADFEGKGVSFLLGMDFQRRSGLLDVLDGTVALEDVVTTVDFAQNLDLLTGGQAAGFDWPDVLSTHRWPQLAEQLRERYDLVIIDLPPFLQIAYAVPIVRATDGVVVVIPHKSSVSRGAELAERLRFVGVETLGYLYVKSPLRREIGLVSRLATDEERRPGQRGKRAVLDPAPVEADAELVRREQMVAPSVAEPPVAESVAAEPAMVESPVAETVAAEPVAAESVAAEPVEDEPVEDEPVEGEPVGAPSAAEPEVADEPMPGAATPPVTPPAGLATRADILPASLPEVRLGQADDDEADDEEADDDEADDDEAESFTVAAGVPRASLLAALHHASVDSAPIDSSPADSTVTAALSSQASHRPTPVNGQSSAGMSRTMTDEAPAIEDQQAGKADGHQTTVRTGTASNRSAPTRTRTRRRR